MNTLRHGRLPGALILAVLALPALILPVQGQSVEEVARQLIATEFQRSTLSTDEQLAELLWFHEAARPYRGMEINTVAEELTTHQYEATVLAEAFEALTGIRVNHQIIPEGDLVDRMQQQMQTGESLHDAYINDSDAIGTHFRYDTTIALSEAMENEWRHLTLPTLELDDFIGLDYTTGPDGRLYQLPAQQFANLYWFRYDWFQRPDLQSEFRDLYGYDLGVPVNWAAYEDIAEFFSEHVRFIDGRRVYGHMDYGRRDPSLGWRFHDAWLSMAGGGDTGLPNGLPVDEWGIRVEQCHPVGSDVTRGGGTNAPPAVYAVSKMVEWLRQYAPPEAQNMSFTQAGPVPGRGQIAQQIFWYTTFTADLLDPGLPVTDDNGDPLWRMAPSPSGPYWEDGMKVGYQDVGSWTFFDSTPEDRRAAAWLWAQFTVARTVSLEKTLVGLTPIRRSDIFSDAMTEAAPRLGGLVEFYRSPEESRWTPTGTNVPDYPRMAPLWWQNLAPAVSGQLSVQQALDNLARAQDEMMAELATEGRMNRCEPRLNAPETAETWLERPGSPRPALAAERERGRTIPYAQLIRQWQ